MANKSKVKKSAHYAFRSVSAAEVEIYSNDMYKDGWELKNVYKEPNKFWLWFSIREEEAPKE